MEPAKAVCLAFSPSETDRVALLVDIGLGKDLGFPIDFSFFYSPVPDKDQQSGCSIFSEDITGGGGGSESYLLPVSVSARMAVYRQRPS